MALTLLKVSAKRRLFWGMSPYSKTETTELRVQPPVPLLVITLTVGLILAEETKTSCIPTTCVTFAYKIHLKINRKE